MIMGIPDGTRDRLPNECAIRRDFENRLCALFSGAGYGEVSAPTLEFYSTIQAAAVPLGEEDLFTLTDKSGKILVLRPDATIQAARMYASSYAGKTARFFYFEKVFRRSAKHRGIEGYQAGVELIGASGAAADLEILRLASKTLEACGRPFKLEIGHSGLFRELCGRLGADDALSERVRVIVEKKNYAALPAVLGKSEAADVLIKLCAIFGGSEVLDKALEIAGDLQSLRYLADLRPEGASYDLGLVQRIDYYTGIVFQGYVEGVGEPVLLGGRYDGLTSGFGADAPAVGFALDFDAVFGGAV